jgi:serine/threonine-protein kinase
MKVIEIAPGALDALRRAQREVELLEQIDHPHVVKVASDLLQLGTPEHGVTWLEEYLEGDDLSDHLVAAWDWDATKEMALDVADGLSALHDLKVVHRDLSANNVRRLTAGGYVVMDPGLARHTLRSTLTGVFQPGTPGFLSPEHLGTYSGVPTPASDVFCVGILMFLALTTQYPVQYTGDYAEYIGRLARGEISDLTTLRNDLTVEQAALIRQMLHPQSARRPRNGSRLRDALEAVA